MFDPLKKKADFPILSTTVHGLPLVYLDSAATAQKPRAVIEAIGHYYETANANIHRGVHALSEHSTLAWEESRQEIAGFFAADVDELIMVRNTTEALNGVAYGWADHHLKEGDIILGSLLEHHSNFVVWQEVAKRTGCTYQVVGVTPEGRLNEAELTRKLQHPNVKLVALTQVSNALGTQLPIEKIAKQVRALAPKARILIDAAQSAPHLPLDFHQLGVDFLAFSGHKLYGPMGSGGLLVRRELLVSGEMQPWLFGGGMIGEVRLTGTTYNDELADRFTAGTPDVADAVGLAAACRYLQTIGMAAVAQADQRLVQYALTQLAAVPQIQLIGPTQVAVAEGSTGADSHNQDRPTNLDRVGSVAFLYRGVHAHDVAQILDSEGIAVRSGHHCTMPLHEQFGWPATVRASFGLYTSEADIDRLVAALGKVKQVFRYG